MAKLNVPVRTPAARTHEGAVATRIGAHAQLSRITMCAMLWEDQFYVDGKSTADQVKALIPQCESSFLVSLAVAAREEMKLRHMPLLIAREMARCPRHQIVVGELLPVIIQRADELTEFLAIYWKDGRQPLSAQVKKGLAAAFNKFGAYALAKYNRDGPVKLRDVAFLAHVKPPETAIATNATTKERQYKKDGKVVGAATLMRHPDSVLGKLIAGTLPTPDTWEVELSARAGEDKKASWERLIAENKLGGMAFLRNLRNMDQAGVDKGLIAQYAVSMDVSRVLPFRFLAAARHAPWAEPLLEPLMLKALETESKLPGKTILLVDVSGSMSSKVSAKSELSRLDAAKALAILLREICDDIVIIPFQSMTKQAVAPRRGFALGDALGNPGGGTDCGAATRAANSVGYDRVIMITDEQSLSPIGDPLPGKRAYCVNVAAYQNGIATDKWHRINGWSEAIVGYIQQVERDAAGE